MSERERRCYQGCPEILCDDLRTLQFQWDVMLDVLLSADLLMITGGLDDPTGKDDVDFIKVIREIEERIIKLKNSL